jgi:hypothetical protein
MRRAAFREQPKGSNARFCPDFRQSLGGVAHFGDVDKTGVRSYISAAFPPLGGDTEIQSRKGFLIAPTMPGGARFRTP